MEDDNMDKKRKLLVLSLTVFSLILIGSGLTLAFFSYVKNGSTDNTIKSGNITFLYDEENRQGNGISIEDAVPMSEADGKAQTNAFNFKIKSDTAATITLPYEITLRKKDGSDNLDSVIKVYLAKTTGYDATVESEEEVITSLFSELEDETNNGYSEKVLLVDQVPLNSSNYEQNYRLKMWLADDADYTGIDLFDKEFTLTVNVYSKSNLTIKARELKYVSATNEETDEPYTTCSDAQCAIDELYEIYGN